MKKKISIFWFRRDLRTYDNVGLYWSLFQRKNVLPIFIFDTDIINKLEKPFDSRVQFIYEMVESLKTFFQSLGSDLIVRTGKPADVFSSLIEEYNIESVYTNKDYEPYAIKRDHDIELLLRSFSIPFAAFKDQVIFEKSEIVKDDGQPYTIFTPYAKKWKLKLNEQYLKQFTIDTLFNNFYQLVPSPIFPLEYLGFQKCVPKFEKPIINEEVITQYSIQRDYPFINGTTRLSVHLRFGTVSIRQLVSTAIKLNETWLNELIWREFYMNILFHFPKVETQSFKSKYDRIEWRNNAQEFDAWCKGQTGYPIVDAGMRELNETGFMHNRVRMIVASFLTKHLLIDWRWGEAYFASKLLDYDLSANNGGWQWAAGSGCDAAPYFRIFNPYEQTKKFDKDFNYIRRWVPEFEDFNYPKPIVDHKFARERVLLTYKKALNS
jgi:deoxyribodipyrimidine photo-lyase